MTELQADQIKVGRRYRRDLGDVEKLAESIRDVGLLHPVVVTPQSELIAGLRRLQACKLLGWERVPVRVVDLDNILQGEYDENARRKALLPSEAVAITQALEPGEREAATKRQVQLGRTHGTPSGNFPEGSTGRTRDKVGAAVGMSGRTLDKAKAVVESGEEQLTDEMDRTGKVDRVYKKLKAREEANKHAAQAQVSNGPPPRLPGQGPFVEEARKLDQIVRACRGVGQRIENLKHDFGLTDESRGRLVKAIEQLRQLLQ